MTNFGHLAGSVNKQSCGACQGEQLAAGKTGAKARGKKTVCRRQTVGLDVRPRGHVDTFEPPGLAASPYGVTRSIEQITAHGMAACPLP